jgi:hypothetical protein
MRQFLLQAVALAAIGVYGVLRVFRVNSYTSATVDVASRAIAAVVYATCSYGAEPGSASARSDNSSARDIIFASVCCACGRTVILPARPFPSAF